MVATNVIDDRLEVKNNTQELYSTIENNQCYTKKYAQVYDSNLGLGAFAFIFPLLMAIHREKLRRHKPTAGKYGIKPDTLN
ncbi:hypothetical protein BY458DRAFT_586760 [Sporodiniella umbellata]|nr:hypothetical protein BY458DRAFT_586760 [Sporodiniella umbellata]